MTQKRNISIISIFDTTGKKKNNQAVNLSKLPNFCKVTTAEITEQLIRSQPQRLQNSLFGHRTAYSVTEQLFRSSCDRTAINSLVLKVRIFCFFLKYTFIFNF